MCGIVGFVGHEEAAPILLEGLSRLEYRGYDSAGIAVYGQEDGLQVYKAKGPPEGAVRSGGQRRSRPRQRWSGAHPLGYPRSAI